VTERAMARHGLISSQGTSRLVREHMDGTRNRGYTLWAVLMFQIWYDSLYRGFASTLPRRPVTVM
jgi:hypothetical protein